MQPLQKQPGHLKATQAISEEVSSFFRQMQPVIEYLEISQTFSKASKNRLLKPVEMFSVADQELFFTVLCSHDEHVRLEFLFRSAIKKQHVDLLSALLRNKQCASYGFRKFAIMQAALSSEHDTIVQLFLKHPELPVSQLGAQLLETLARKNRTTELLYLLNSFPEMVVSSEVVASAILQLDDILLQACLEHPGKTSFSKDKMILAVLQQLLSETTHDNVQSVVAICKLLAMAGIQIDVSNVRLPEEFEEVQLLNQALQNLESLQQAQTKRLLSNTMIQKLLVSDFAQVCTLDELEKIVASSSKTTGISSRL